MPALTEAVSPYWRSIKYSLFPPLGLATLGTYLSSDDEVEIQDEHLEKLGLDDEPDLVAIQVYITSAHRACEIADGYRNFYRWGSIFRSASSKETMREFVRHLAYTGG